MSNDNVLFSDGNNKTGLFLALATIVEEVNYEDTIDIFHVVKELRNYRPTLLNDGVSLFNFAVYIPVLFLNNAQNLS